MPKRLTEPAWKRLLDFIAVTPTGCFVWQRCKNTYGYGCFSIGGGKMAQAHRASYEAFRGPIPDGLHVLHKCDNPACINPAHLFLGTHDDNMADKTQKQRHLHGGRHHHAKLTDEIVIECRQKHQSGESISSLAEKHGVHFKTMRQAVLRLKWKHVA